MPIALLIIMLLMIMLDRRRPYGLPPSERYRQEFMRRRFMRIEIDGDLERLLDEIKRREWRISGRGHSETVRFLVNYYFQHQAVEEIIDQRLGEIPKVIQQSFLECARTAITNLLKAGDEET